MEINLNLGFLKIYTQTTKHQLLIILLMITLLVFLYLGLNEMNGGLQDRAFILFSNVVTGILAYSISELSKKK